MPAAFDKISDTAMVLAAGFGLRMRPLTENTPKPLIKVGGKPMLDYALDHLKNAGIRRAVVNGHYLADQIAAHVAARKDMELVFSFEPEILDNGGGVKTVRQQFGDKPFFVLNADLPWFDGAAPALARMAEMWDSAKMDALMLLLPTAKAKGFSPKGDYFMADDGRIWRKGTEAPRPYVWISAMLVAPQLYDEIHERIFAYNLIFDLAESRKRLFGIAHDGTCYHVGTPEDLHKANALLESGEGWG